MAICSHIPDAYLIEEEAEDNCSDEAPRWPQKQVARPSIAFFAANRLPRMTKPQPLEERWVKEAAQNKIDCASTAAAIASTEGAYKKKMAELAAAETESKGVNKWSATRSTSAALIKRLEEESADLLQKKKVAGETFEKTFSAGETARWMLKSQEKMEKLWEDHKQMIYEEWDAEFGKHYPRRTTSDLFAYYDVVEKPEEFGDGWTRFVFKAGTDVKHICRELEIGGYEETYYGVKDEKPWLEVPTSVLKSFETS